MSIRELVLKYYESIQKKDDNWQNVYAEDAVFSDSSHTLSAKGREAVVQTFIPFLKGVVDVKASQLIVEENRACAIVDYIYVNSKGEKMNQTVAEVWRAKGDHLCEEIIYFDLTAYRNFMRG